ncbi:hypothetical protein MVEN_01702900 [Mycena venus]|uniref:Uncharacterized protein n=1 Tax=Mycena venus TaxID=2733690 RepID=A0A8H6XP16_9AGAR|nr:hypothetical protein MVEN_01702900 [Mycena venus]
MSETHIFSAFSFLRGRLFLFASSPAPHFCIEPLLESIILVDMMMKFNFFVLTAAAALTAVAAASIRRDNSSSCGSALESLVTSSDPAFNCLAPSALKDVFDLGTKNPSAAEVETTLDTWLTDFCGVGTCSSDTIGKISAAVNTTCGVDAFNTTDFSELRELLCLKDTVTNTFCTVETLKSGNDTDTDTNANNTNTTTDPGEILFTIFLASTTLFTPCNECAKAQYQLAVKQGSTDTGTLDHCGANFTANLNSTVVGVKQVGVTGEFKNAAGALTPTTGLLFPHDVWIFRVTVGRRRGG